LDFPGLGPSQSPEIHLCSWKGGQFPSILRSRYSNIVAEVYGLHNHIHFPIKALTPRLGSRHSRRVEESTPRRSS
jgi:hypothetical protein